jgi:hypothetical protein
MKSAQRTSARRADGYAISTSVNVSVALNMMVVVRKRSVRDRAGKLARRRESNDGSRSEGKGVRGRASGGRRLDLTLREVTID